MKSILEILDEISVKSGSRGWLDCLQSRTSAYNNLLIKEAAEIYANQTNSEPNEWITLEPDSEDTELYPSDFDPVLCQTETGEYQVLQLVKYTCAIQDWEWDTVGLKRNQSYPIDYVKKYQHIEAPLQ